MIEYSYTSGKGANHTPIRVRLDGKVCGTIKEAQGGFRYVPDGVRSNDGGEVFTSVQKVQESLI